jgi:hypothetical protein
MRAAGSAAGVLTADAAGWSGRVGVIGRTVAVRKITPNQRRACALGGNKFGLQPLRRCWGGEEKSAVMEKLLARIAPSSIRRNRIHDLGWVLADAGGVGRVASVCGCDNGNLGT